MNRNGLLMTGALCMSSLFAVNAMAGSHLWQINEAYSNADGTIQFIEMKECCGAPSEIGLNNKWVKSVQTGQQFDFPGNISGNTANRHLLLATAGFASLPGAPTPDFIIADGFFSTNQDTLEYWFYGPATMTIPLFALPTDGVNSLDRNGAVLTNSPTNYAGASGSVIAACDPADLSNNGAVDFADVLEVIARWGQTGLNAADLSGNGTVDFADVLAVIASWGPCP